VLHAKHSATLSKMNTPETLLQDSLPGRSVSNCPPPPSSRLRFLWLLWLPLALSSCLCSAEKPASTPTQSPSRAPQLDEIDNFDPHAPEVTKVPSSFIFSILPKSIDRNPHMDVSILCQMTEEGKRRDRVTKSNPCYYASHLGGYRHGGDDYDTKTPLPEEVRRVIDRALLHNGFLPSTESKRPGILLIIHWGTNSVHHMGDSFATLLERANLVGGAAFARELCQVLNEEAQFYQTSNIDTMEGGETGTILRGSRNLAREAMAKAATPGDMVRELVAGPAGASLSEGGALTTVADHLSPLSRFKNRDRQTEALVEQTMNGLYFVLISAYDYEAGLKGKRMLLWRARMTVDSNGLSITDALPSLVAHSAPYLGRDMPAAQTMTPRFLRGKSQVDIGELKVIEEPKKKK